MLDDTIVRIVRPPIGFPVLESGLRSPSFVLDDGWKTALLAYHAMSCSMFTTVLSPLEDFICMYRYVDIVIMPPSKMSVYVATSCAGTCTLKSSLVNNIHVHDCTVAKRRCRICNARCSASLTGPDGVSHSHAIPWRAPIT